MFVFDTQLDVYKIVFMLELLVSEALFVYKLKRRRYFALRLIGSVCVCFLCAFLFPASFFNAAYMSVMFLLLFSVTVFGAKFCFDESWYDIIFCCTAAYTVQHIAYEVYNFTVTISGISGMSSGGLYGDEQPQAVNGYQVVIYVGIYGTVYWLFYFLFGDKLRIRGERALRGVALLLLAVMIILVDIVLNAIVSYHSAYSQDYVYYTVVFIYNLLSCLLALTVQFGLLSRRKLERELRIIYELRDREKQQFEVSQESMDLINRKCHDIKHQIRSFGKSKFMSDEDIKEMEEAISIYDTSVKTGNKALDVILSEKRLQCKMNDINLTCMADGEKLNFIKDSSIYALFGNMLDNAIEAVMKLDKERRIIGLIVRRDNDILTVSCYNYYSGKLTFDGDLPVTSKGDKQYHGYGMKSVKTIAEGYGGSVSVVTDDDIFTLNIMFPVQSCAEQKAEKTVEKHKNRVLTVPKKKALKFFIPLFLIMAYVGFGLLIVSNYYTAVTAFTG